MARRLRPLSAACATLLVLGFTFAACGSTLARDRHILWRVEGQRNTVYLLGSIHVLRAADGGLPPVADAAYADADVLVMEIDMDDPQTGDPAALLATMRRTALLPDGESLRTVLGEEYPALQQQLQRLGLDAALFDRFEPWIVAVTVTQLELQRRGFDPTLGIESRLTARAGADSKPIIGLETPEQQFAILSGLSLELQREFLRSTLEDSAALDTEIENLVRAWRAGDVEALARELSDEFERAPELYRPLTETRNRAWVGQIAELLDDKDDYLVVVGALHLIGRDSVVELLRGRGFKVEQQ